MQLLLEVCSQQQITSCMPASALARSARFQQRITVKKMLQEQSTLSRAVCTAARLQVTRGLLQTPADQS